MEFKLNEKKPGNWEQMMFDLQAEDQLHGEMLKKLQEQKQKEAEIKRQKHLAHLKKYHFTSTDEFVNFLKAGGKAVPEYGYYNEDIQYWDKPEQFWKGYVEGPKFRIATMDYNDIDIPIGIYADYKDEDEFRKWIDKLFSFGEKYLDNGYLPMWHKVLIDDDYEDCE